MKLSSPRTHRRRRLLQSPSPIDGDHPPSYGRGEKRSHQDTWLSLCGQNSFRPGGPSSELKRDHSPSLDQLMVEVSLIRP